MTSIMYETFNNYYLFKVLIINNIILGAYNSIGQLLFKREEETAKLFYYTTIFGIKQFTKQFKKQFTKTQASLELENLLKALFKYRTLLKIELVLCH